MTIVILYLTYLLQQRPLIITVGIEQFASNETVPEASHFTPLHETLCIYL